MNYLSFSPPTRQSTSLREDFVIQNFLGDSRDGSIESSFLIEASDLPRAKEKTITIYFKTNFTVSFIQE